MTIIGNKDEMKEFFDTLMLPLKDDEVYILLGVARRKWDTNIPPVLSRSEEALAKEIIVDYDFEKFYRTILRLDVSDEVFVDVKTGKPIPSSCKGYYIDLTPKSMSKALVSFFQETMQDIIESRTNQDTMLRIRRAKSHLFSNVVTHNAHRTPYKIIDIDVKGPGYPQHPVLNFLKDNKVPVKWVSETRGGYHVIIETGEHLERFYRNVVPKIQEHNDSCRGALGKEAIELSTSAQAPIAGTYQGGFLVRRVKV